jgi:hypothetical protein
MTDVKRWVQAFRQIQQFSGVKRIVISREFSERLAAHLVKVNNNLLEREDCGPIDSTVPMTVCGIPIAVED